jgi:hypothetical protein
MNLLNYISKGAVAESRSNLSYFSSIQTFIILLIYIMERQVNLTKLVRLTTLDDNCIFDAQFDEELYIAPETEIALKSCTVAFASGGVVLGLGNANNFISIFHDAVEYQIPIPPGIYSPKNTLALLNGFSQKFNGAMTFGTRASETGMEYLLLLNQQNRVEIQNLRAQPISITGEDYYAGPSQEGRYWDKQGLTVTEEGSRFANDGRLHRTGGGSTAPNYDCVAYPDFSFTGGCGFWRSTISHLNAPGGAADVNGFAIGFVNGGDGRKKLEARSVTDGDVVVGMRVQATQAGGVGNYEFKSSASGAYVDTGVAVVTRTNGDPSNNNDVIEWVSTKSPLGVGLHVIRCVVHQLGVGATVIGEVTRAGVLAPDQYLTGFYSLYGAQFFNDITETLYTPSFFNSPVDPKELDRFKNSNSLYHAGVKSVLPTLADLDYHTRVRYRMATENRALKENIMGFDGSLVKDVPNTFTLYDITAIDLTFDATGAPPYDYRRPVAEFGREGVIGVIAPTQSFLFFGSNNYVVELLNLPLNSYDSFPQKKGRANILCVIPQNEFNQGNLDTVLMYEPNEMTYVGLTNKSELSLRNIRARIVFPDYTKVETFGMSSIVLHLRPSK